MDSSLLTYLIFAGVLLLALAFDLGLLSRKQTPITIQKALWQTLLWVGIALAFFVFLWFEKGRQSGIEYLSAYMMEWSLSIDNIFVFLILFKFLKVKEKYAGRVLLIGILLAILLRIFFISVGVVLVAEFHWLLYVFGGILFYTGGTMFFSRHDEETNLEDNRVYRFMKGFFPLSTSDGGGKLTIHENGKKKYTTIFVVIVLLATTDIVFAVDSIPAVFGITQDRLVIYTSNVFAVLGLRSLFFLLRGAIDRFRYLPQGIAIVLVFIGVKMLIEYFKIILPVYSSLLAIVGCIGLSMLFSILRKKI